MSDDVIKNPNRGKNVKTEPWQPEYKRLGITPKKYPNQMSLLKAAVVLPTDEVNKAEEAGTKNILNSVIDNNEFMSFHQSFDADLNTQELEEAVESGETIDLDKSKSQLSLPEIGQFVLMVSGKIILSGEHFEIEKKVQNLLYGEDVDFNLTPVSLDEITVLKRVAVKAGVFVEG